VGVSWLLRSVWTTAFTSPRPDFNSLTSALKATLSSYTWLVIHILPVTTTSILYNLRMPRGGYRLHVSGGHMSCIIN
jgi:hypothetical protein